MPETKYVHFDGELSKIVVELPPELEHWKPQLQIALAEAFWGEPENGQTAGRMAGFVERWLNERGVA